MHNRGKILALDYGSKRIGVAVSDSSQQLCFIRPFWENLQNKEVLLQKVKIFCEEEGISQVLVGIPYFADGSESEQTLENRKIADFLAENLQFPVETFDESFSSFEADQLMKEATLKGENSKDLRDSFSAYVMLNNYLQQ